MNISCKGCDHTWTGKLMAHCGEYNCHKTFSTVANFDKHRYFGHCLASSELIKKGMVQNAQGTWLMSGEWDVSSVRLLPGKSPGS